MLTLVLGGSASGKSEYAEQLVLEAGAGPRFYIATMEPYDEECLRRISRHRAMRASKGFETLECPRGLAGLALPRREALWRAGCRGGGSSSARELMSINS